MKAKICSDNIQQEERTRFSDPKAELPSNEELDGEDRIGYSKLDELFTFGEGREFRLKR